MKKIFSITLLSLLFFSFFTSVQAQEDRGLVGCDLIGEDRCTFCDFFRMLDRILDFLLLRIIPALAALMIAIGGVMYILSRGNPEDLARAKKLFVSVGIGMLIIYGAWLLVYAFLLIIGGVAWRGFGGNWWVINC
jgi:hypothetical protein